MLRTYSSSSSATYIDVYSGKGKLFVTGVFVGRVSVELAQSSIEFDGEQRDVNIVQAADGGRVGPSHGHWRNY